MLDETAVAGDGTITVSSHSHVPNLAGSVVNFEFVPEVDHDLFKDHSYLSFTFGDASFGSEHVC